MIGTFFRCLFRSLQLNDTSDTETVLMEFERLARRFERRYAKQQGNRPLVAKINAEEVLREAEQLAKAYRTTAPLEIPEVKFLKEVIDSLKKEEAAELIEAMEAKQ